mmetsp:Transcript_25547/g.36379  ORF Transcript_25547/g.36379 Transcript_25547/m.36379 type:complete len:223 (-) Transcript_25547:11-679(-)
MLPNQSRPRLLRPPHVLSPVPTTATRTRPFLQTLSSVFQNQTPRYRFFARGIDKPHITHSRRRTFATDGYVDPPVQWVHLRLIRTVVIVVVVVIVAIVTIAIVAIVILDGTRQRIDNTLQCLHSLAQMLIRVKTILDGTPKRLLQSLEPVLQKLHLLLLFARLFRKQLVHHMELLQLPRCCFRIVQHPIPLLRQYRSFLRQIFHLDRTCLVRHTVYQRLRMV